MRDVRRVEAAAEDPDPHGSYTVHCRSVSDDLDDTVAASPDALDAAADQGPGYLVVVRGGPVGEVHRIAAPTTVIGRAPEADLRFNDEGMSRLHCRLRQDAAGVVVEDLASRNGTYCNGERLGLDPRSLVEGDRLQLGTSVLLWFTYVPSSVEPITISGRDIAIAKHVQTSLLPRKLDVEGLEVSASMVPAAEVGGDYYDVIPVADGCWLAIGDVTGHGLHAGLIMLMIQSVVGTLVRAQPDAAPADLLRALNEQLYDNIRQRLQHDEHVTFTLLRYTVDGRLRFVGAHEELVLWRAATGKCERVITPGTWLGIGPNIDHALIESTIALAEAICSVLYTDGLTEAMTADHQQFGIARVEAIVERCRDRPTAEIEREILGELARWTPKQDDDVTLVVLRYRGAPVSSTARRSDQIDGVRAERVQAAPLPHDVGARDEPDDVALGRRELVDCGQPGHEALEARRAHELEPEQIDLDLADAEPERLLVNPPADRVERVLGAQIGVARQREREHAGVPGRAGDQGGARHRWERDRGHVGLGTRVRAMILTSSPSRLQLTSISDSAQIRASPSPEPVPRFAVWRIAA